MILTQTRSQPDHTCAPATFTGDCCCPFHLAWALPMGMGAAAWTLDGDAVPFARFAATDQPTGTDFWRERELTQRPMYLAGWTPEVEAYAGIGLKRSRAAILLISGSAHKLWPSSIASERAVLRLRSKNYGSPYKSVAYEGAGHRVTGPSGIDFGQSDGAFHPVIKAWVPLGGSPNANAEASLAAFR
jgi:hypothetical protein